MEGRKSRMKKNKGSKRRGYKVKYDENKQMKKGQEQEKGKERKNKTKLSII